MPKFQNSDWGRKVPTINGSVLWWTKSFINYLINMNRITKLQLWYEYCAYCTVYIRCTVNIDKLYTQILKSLLENWTFCCHVLSSRHCTSSYTETVDPACQPSITQKQYWHSSVRQGSDRFNLTEDEPATCLFRSCYIIYLWQWTYTSVNT